MAYVGRGLDLDGFELRQLGSTFTQLIVGFQISEVGYL